MAADHDHVPHLLFVCSGRGARAVMAVRYMEALAGPRLRVSAAGFQTGPLPAVALRVMQEAGLPIGVAAPDRLFDVIPRSPRLDVVVSICQNAHFTLCDVFESCVSHLGEGHRIVEWQVPEPARPELKGEAGLELGRTVRDEIRRLCLDLLERLEIPASPLPRAPLDSGVPSVSP